MSAKVVEKKCHHALEAGRLLRISITAILLVVFFSMESRSTPADQKTVYFGARTDVRPFSFREDGKWNGYTIELCKKIFNQYSKDQSIKGGPELLLAFEHVNAATRFSSLKKEGGKIQAVCGATTVTIERMKTYNFTLLTFISGASVIKRKNIDVRQLLRPMDKNADMKVCFVGDTTTEVYLDQMLGDSIKLLQKDDHNQAFSALKNGEASFYFGDRIILRQLLHEHNNPQDFVLAPGFLSYEPYAVAVRKQNADLLYSANKALARLYRSGEIYEIYHRWFGDAQMSSLLKALFELQKIPE